MEGDGRGGIILLIHFVAADSVEDVAHFRPVVQLAISIQGFFVIVLGPLVVGFQFPDVGHFQVGVGHGGQYPLGFLVIVEDIAAINLRHSILMQIVIDMGAVEKGGLVIKIIILFLVNSGGPFEFLDGFLLPSDLLFQNADFHKDFRQKGFLVGNL